MEISVEYKQENRIFFEGVFSQITESVSFALLAVLVFGIVSDGKTAFFAGAFAFVISLLTSALKNIKHHIFALLPSAAVCIITVIFSDKFLSGSAVVLNGAEKAFCIRKGEIFFQTTASGGKYFFTAAVITILAAALEFLPKNFRRFLIDAAAMGISAYFSQGFALCVCVLICISAAYFSEEKVTKKSLLCILLIALLGFAAVCFSVGEKVTASTFVSEAREHITQAYYGKAEIEVIMEQPQMLYLRESVCDTEYSQEVSERSECFYRLYEEDFYPALQGKNLSQAVQTDNTSTVTVNVKRGKTKYPLVPYGAADCENLTADKKSIGGDNFNYSDGTVTSFQILNSYPTDLSEYVNKLYDGQTTESEKEYLLLEQQYREFAKSCFCKLSAEESSVIEVSFGSVQKLTAFDAAERIKQFITAEISPSDKRSSSEKGGDFLRTILQVDKTGTQEEYAFLTMHLARYCGVPSRVCTGYIISDKQAQEMSANSAVTLTGSDRHIWAEIYIDAIGWVPLETYPEFEADISFGDISQEGQGGYSLGTATGTSEKPSAEKSPAPSYQTVSDNSENNAENHSALMVCLSAALTAVVLIILTLYAARKLSFMRKLNSPQPEIKAEAAHLMGIKLAKACPDERENISVSSELSERIYEKLLFSQNGITSEEADKCIEFYFCAKKAFCRNQNSFKRFLLCTFKNLV